MVKCGTREFLSKGMGCLWTDMKALEKGNVMSTFDVLKIIRVPFHLSPSPLVILLFLLLLGREDCESTWLFVCVCIAYFLKLKVGEREGFSYCVDVHVETLGSLRIKQGLITPLTAFSIFFLRWDKKMEIDFGKNYKFSFFFFNKRHFSICISNSSA